MITLLALLAAPAWPCAGLFHEEGLAAESDTQEAILAVGDGSVSVSYRVEYDGDAADFGWVIPVPGEVQTVSDGDEGDFDLLRDATAPMVSWEYAYDDDETCGCGASDKAGGGRNGDTGSLGVDVVAEGFTGSYDYAVLEADSADALLTWLSDNGWSVGPSEDSIDAYVSDGIFQFVAIKLTPTDGDTPDEGRALPPLSIEYAGDDVRFPSRMARYSEADELRTTVWVVADERYTLTAGWSEAAMEDISGGIDDDPVALFQDALRDAAGDSANFAVVYAGSWDGGFVTRFDTLADRAVHDADAEFGPAGTTDSASVQIWLSEYAALFLAPGLLFGWAWRRRRDA